MRYDNIKYSSFHIQLIHTLCANVFCHLDDTFEFCRTDAGREICMRATRTNVEGSEHVRENGVFPNKRTHVEMVWVEMARKFAQRL